MLARRRFIRLLVLASGPLAPAEGAYLPPGEVVRLSSDLNAGLQLLSARREGAWLPRIPSELIICSTAGGEESAACSAPNLYLLGGKLALDQGLLRRLPQPPGSRPLPLALKGKDFFGGTLRWSGRNAHLVPPGVLGILPVSERRFVYWDERGAHLPLYGSESAGHAWDRGHG